VALALMLAVAICAMWIDWPDEDEALPDPARALHETARPDAPQPRMIEVTMHDPLGRIVLPARASSAVTEPEAIPGSMGNVMGASATAPSFLPPRRLRTGPVRGSATDEDEDSESPGSPSAPTPSGWGWLADGAAARVAPPAAPAASLPNRAWTAGNRDFSPMAGRRGDADDYLLPPALTDPTGDRMIDALPFTFDAPAGGGGSGDSRVWTPRSWTPDTPEMR
jgi:hypothetical protein